MIDRGNELDKAYFADGRPALMEKHATLDVEAIAQALVNIYHENVDVDHDIEEHLFRETRRLFSEAVAEGYADASERQVPLPDETFRDAFLHSADVFSAFRVHKMQRDIAAQMIDGKGQLKPFSKFVKDVSPYIEHRNRAWLQTEYDTAIIRAQNAAEWKQFQDEKDVYPNLEWIPSTSPNPGADHRVFWGTVLPVDDPFWDEHKPGDRWNCKCELRQTDKQSTPVPVSDGKSDPAPGLESNPAKAKEVFSDNHPYYPDNCLTCPFAGNRLMALAHDLAQGKHCNRCGRVNKCIATAEKRAEAKRVSAKKEEMMSIVRAHQVAAKRPGGLKRVKAMRTGKMLDSKKSFVSLYHHEMNVGEVQAIISFYSKPSKVKFVRISPLGEGKDMSTPIDAANIAKKRARGVTHYNVYEFNTSNGLYILKTEVRRTGFEIPYFIRRKE